MTWARHGSSQSQRGRVSGCRDVGLERGRYLQARDVAVAREGGAVGVVRDSGLLVALYRDVEDEGGEAGL